MKLLVVENDASVARNFSLYLGSAGFVVDQVATGAAALELLRLNTYNAMSTELLLPDMTGLDLLSERNTTPNGPIPCIVITAQELKSRVAALKAGADDCIAKPVDMEELVARFHALLRRPRSYRSSLVKLGDLKIDYQAQSVWIFERQLGLTRNEFLLLSELVSAYPGVLGKDYLENRLYSYEQSVSRNAIEALVSRLRRKLLEAGSPIGVETRRGIGYRLAEQ